MNNTAKAHLTYLLVLSTLLLGAYFYDTMNPNNYDPHAKLCEGREGLTVAEVLPYGKARYRRPVKLVDGSTMTYRDWVNKCQLVELPSNR